MKIQCDVCTKHHATFFCSADEAALCDACDHRVHHANTLASKHQRFSLTYPSTNHHLPLCDVCQERRGFVFCQEDRAILCRECDVPIHSANELTKNHNRFLLTGIKFTATATATAMPYSQSPPNKNHSAETNEQVGSSISEYLINTIPGMKFEDFLDSHTLPFPYSNVCSFTQFIISSHNCFLVIWI
uniref:Salt tolerance-like protein At1g75540 family n=1 Tax=Cajanus cajan TaxID=3821 RepID=A0A151RQM0_CAJCA|nr:putative salt tolerance-like protein At1g75540 family [Cajanus cajan]